MKGQGKRVSVRGSGSARTKGVYNSHRVENKGARLYPWGSRGWVLFRQIRTQAGASA